MLIGNGQFLVLTVFHGFVYVINQYRIIFKVFIDKDIIQRNVITGDQVELIEKNNNHYVSKIAERKNFCIRPKVVNIDYIFLVFSVVEPRFIIDDLFHWLFNYEILGFKTVIIFSKMDILTPDEQKKFWQEVLFLRAYGFMLIDGNDQNNFKKQMRKILEPDDIICLSGKSGVGKTTLINKLIPELSLRACSVSTKTKLGRHTTTNNQLIIWDDYFIADTAGFMVFNLNFKPGHYANVLAKIVGAHSCHFHNCLHLGESRCALKMTLSRDNNGKKWYSLYLKLIKKVAFLN